MVPVVDLRRRATRWRTEMLAATTTVLDSGRLLLGEQTEAFEDDLARWAGRAHVVAVSSGAAALQLALHAVGVGPGDEVIVPAFTAVPTAAAACT